MALGADPHLGVRTSGVWPGREGSPASLTPKLLTPQGASGQMGMWPLPLKWEAQGLEWLRSKGGPMTNHTLLGHFLMQGKT